MRLRTRVVNSATALVAVAVVVGALAPSASAFADAHFVPQSNLTVRVTYPSPPLDHGIYFCAATAIATDLTQCNSATMLFAVTTGTSTLPASPATLSEGMDVVDSLARHHALPAGHYSLVFVYLTGGSPAIGWAGGIQNVQIGAEAAPIPPWVQAVGRTAAGVCAEGWGPSWQDWAVPTTGGYVCSREIPSLG